MTRKLHPAFALAAAGLAFLLTTAYAQQAERTKASAGRRSKLAALVSARQARTARIAAEIADLRRRIEDLRQKGSARSIQEQIDALSFMAGRTPLEGPGVVVTLADSPLAEDEESPDFRIQDLDMQIVVNELWAAGAEAIAVNGQRIVSTSAIRSAGQSILVNYRVLTSPYTIAVIGPTAALQDRFEQSETAERFRTWTQVYRLTISVDPSDHIRVPAFAGGTRLQHARPAPRPTP